MAGARRRGRPRTAWIIIIIIIIIHEYYYGGAVALLLQDHLTMSASRRESIYRETLLKQHNMDNIKTWTGLSVEESVRMTEDRDKWRKYVHGVANRRIEDGKRTEHIQSVKLRKTRNSRECEL